MASAKLAVCYHVYFILFATCVCVYGDPIRPTDIWNTSSSRKQVEEDIDDVLELTPNPDAFTVNFSLKPGEKYITLFMDSKRHVEFNISIFCKDSIDVYLVTIESTENMDVLTIGHIPALQIYCSSYTNHNSDRNYTIDGSRKHHDLSIIPEPEIYRGSGNERSGVKRAINVTLNSELIGISSVVFKFYKNITNASNPYLEPIQTTRVDVLVVREMHVIDTVFVVCVYALEILEMLLFGTQLKVETLKHTLKRPKGPVIGFLCQYLGMPLISYGIAKIIQADSMAALGIFIAGICPGGGSSNIYTYLLHGDLSMSITMTTVSTLMSLVMMPLWLYTVGTEFLAEYEISIPYEDIIFTLSIILVPLAVGLFVQNRFTRATDVIQQVLPILLTVLALCLITVGIYSSLYIFRLFDLKIVIVGCCLPYIGFIIGGLVAAICQQTWIEIKTIAIETGMQNTGIGFILLVNTLQPPLADLSSVAPIAAEVMSPIPTLVIAIAFLIRQKCCKKYKAVTQDDNKVETKDNAVSGSKNNV